MSNIPLYQEVILCISFGINFISFFFFYFNTHRYKTNSKLQTVFMINSIFHSILNYLNLTLIVDSLFTKTWTKKLITVLYSFMHENGEQLLDLNNYLIFPIISIILVCEILICLELIQIVKNPINNKSVRMNIFIVIIVLYFISMIIYRAAKAHPGDVVTKIMFLITYPLLLVITIWTTLIIFIVHSTSSVLFSSRKLVFCIIHCSSIWFFILIMAFPYYLSLANDAIDSIQYDVMLYMNICSCLLNAFRLTEVHILKKNTKSNRSQMTKTTELFQMLKSGNTSSDYLLSDSIKSNSSRECYNNRSTSIPLNSDTTLIDISVLSQNNFIYECYVYLIRGILKIAEIETDKTLQYNIKPVQYLQSRNHKYQIENKVIKNIITSEPRRRRFWNQFLKQFKIFSKKVQLIEYAPEIFRNIRSFNKINEQQLKISFDLDKNIASFSNYMESEGKSGSLFFFTYDYKYIFKTISERERKTLTHNFLQPYYELLAENNSTSLSRIYGAYVLNIGMIKINFILMENICPFPAKIPLYKFDLKGSELGRSTKRLLQNTSKTLKDLDYEELVFKQSAATIILNDLDIPRIKENLTEDLDFLQKTHLMDYSLFIAITDNNQEIIKGLQNYNDQNKRYYISQDKKYIYLFGIIDYLTKYDKWKNLENKCLHIRYLTGKQRFSAIEPLSYRVRFYNYLVSNIFLTSKQRDLKYRYNRITI